MSLRRDAFAALSHMVPDQVLMHIRRGKHPLRAWMDYRGMQVFELAQKALDCDSGAARDAFAVKLTNIMDGGRQLSPTLVSYLAEALDIPDVFLLNSFYREFGINV